MRCFLWVMLLTAVAGAHHRHKARAHSRRQSKIWCPNFYNDDNGQWKPSNCVEIPQFEGEQCRLVCNEDKVLEGESTVTCTAAGWSSLPQCIDPQEPWAIIHHEIGKLRNDQQFLFFIDQSCGGSEQLFEQQKKFVEAIIRAFPLSKDRSAGLIVYNQRSKIRIPIYTDDTCRFLRATQTTPHESRGTGDLADALYMGINEVATRKAHDRTLYILMSASKNPKSYPQAMASQIKQSGDSLMTLALEGSDPEVVINLASSENLYFDLQDTKYFNFVNHKIIEEFSVFNGDCTYQPPMCEGLSMDPERGKWYPRFCEKEVQGGVICSLICNPDFILQGGAELKCGFEGWLGPNGPITAYPTCQSSGGVGGGLIDDIYGTLKYKNSCLLFVLDRSGSVTINGWKQELAFTEALVNAFPLSDIRRGGAIGFSENAITEIPLLETDTCAFRRKLKKMEYDAGGTDMGKALYMAHQENLRNNPSQPTIVFIVSDGESQTDPKFAASVIMERKDIIFTIGVADFNLSQLLPITSLSPSGQPLFYGFDNFKVMHEVTHYLNETFSASSIDCSHTRRRKTKKHRLRTKQFQRG